MKYFFLLSALLTVAIAHAQNKVKLNEHATVMFPGKAEQMNSEAGPLSYSTLDPENKVTGTAAVIDATQYGVDSGMIVANYNNSMFVELILQGLIGQYPGVTMVSKKKIAKGNFMGYDLEFRKDNPDETVPYRNLYVQVFFSGAQIYALTVLAEDKATDIATYKERFFNSLVIQ